MCPITAGGAGRGAKANSSASDVNHGVSEKLHIPRSYYVNDEEETFENYNNSYRNHPVLERAGANASRMEAGKGSLREQLEEVTRERDRLRNSQEQSEAAWKRQVKRLEEQLEMANMREGSERIHKVGRGWSCWKLSEGFVEGGEVCFSV